MIDRFVIAADRLRNAKDVTRIGAVTVTHHVLGAEKVGVATVLTVLRRRREVRMMYGFEWNRKHRECCQASLLSVVVRTSHLNIYRRISL